MRAVRAVSLPAAAALLLGAAASFSLGAAPQDPPDRRPEASIDLATDEGVALVHGQWRYSDTRIVEAEFPGPGPDNQPTGPIGRTYDYEPHAGAADFDDSRWEAVAPSALGGRRGHGRLGFDWYRITVTVPERIGAYATTGKDVVFETTVDDAAEIWVDGELTRYLGQRGGSMVAGWNAPNRLVVARHVKPGQKITLAVFGINGPLSNPPSNFIYVGGARLDFYTVTPGPRRQASARRIVIPGSPSTSRRAGSATGDPGFARDGPGARDRFPPMTTLDRRAFVALSAGSLLSLRLGPRTSPTPGSEVKTAGIRLIPVDGKYKVWTKRLGAGKIKVLTLHGGPGFTHEYFECFEDFLPQAGVEFYYYDQLGSFYSDQPDDKSLWTIDRFREEVEQVRQALGLEDFYLYGQSWGSMLAIEYALKYQRHLKALVLSSMTASIASYVEYVNKLKAALPPAVLSVLNKYEATGDFDNPEYQAVMLKEVYGRHVCRLEPWPDPVARAFKHFNPQVYNTMQGPNEFVVTGTFKDWDRWKDLPRIEVPTLVIGARYDEMNPDDIRRMGRLLPRSRTAILENGSHLAMWDDQEAYFRALVSFLQDVQSGRFAPAR